MSLGDLVDGIPAAEAVRDAAEAVSEGDWGGLIGSGISLGSSIADIGSDPIGSFFAAGFGWAIEHNPILRYALDAVSGDEEAIDAVCETWEEKVATPLAGVATAVAQASTSTTSGWQGEAADAYRAATTTLAGHSEALSTAASSAATGLRGAGTLVLEVRSFIRDELSSFLGWTVASYAVAAASSAPTFGASVATFINTTILRGAALGQRFSRTLTRLADRLDGWSDQLSVLGKAADALRRAATKVDGIAGSATRVANAGTVPSALTSHLINGVNNAAPSLPGGLDLAIAGTSSGFKVAGDMWKTSSGIEGGQSA